MFRWFPLVWANLGRRKMRLFLTFASIFIAFMLFGLLEAFRTSIDGGVNLAGADRLILRNKSGLTVPLPLAYYERIKTVEGVSAAATSNFFGAVSRTPQNPNQEFFMFATQPAAFIEVTPELGLKPEEAEAWRKDRQGMIVGQQVAQMFGWKKGDHVPVRSQFLQKTDGTNTWQFNIVAVYEAESPFLNQVAYINYDYYNESLMSFFQNSMGTASIRVRDANEGEAIARKIDAMFANSAAETETVTEREWARRWRDQIGDMTIIVTSVTMAVFFTMLLVTANRMAQSVRERTNEIGVLKTLGFGPGLIMTLVLLESLLLTVSAAMAGVAVAYGVHFIIEPMIKARFPGFTMELTIFLWAAILSVGFGLVSGLWPSLMALRLKVVDALRRA